MTDTTTRKPSAPAAPTPAEKSADLCITRSNSGQITAMIDGVSTVVQVRQCFPWSQPKQYISLRDDKNNEIALIKDLAELDESSRDVIAESLTDVGFVFEIQSIQSLQTEFEIRNWKVTTRQGPCTFQTALDEWPRTLPDGSIVIKDVCGNLFHIPDTDALDDKSRKRIWAFIG